MEKRSKSQGVHAGNLTYIYPNNNGIPARDAAAAIELNLPIERLMTDLHVDGSMGAVGEGEQLFLNPPVPNFNQGAVNLEINAGTHDMQRALDEASDLIDWFNADTNVTDRMPLRTSSFCAQAQTQFDNFDQGLSFFLPNMTWLQPPGWVHAGVAKTWAEITLRSVVEFNDLSSQKENISFAAQYQTSQDQLVLRLVNRDAKNSTAKIRLVGAEVAVGTMMGLWTLTAADPSVDNPPSDPLLISPIEAKAPTTHPAVIELQLPGFSVVLASVKTSSTAAR